MWVRQHSLIPGMEHSEEPEVRTEPALVAGDSKECFRNAAEQQVVDQLRVLLDQRRKCAGQREDNVAVRNGQKFFCRLYQPPFTGSGLTLWAMPVAARMKLDALVRAVVALCKESAERGGSTGADVPEHFALLSGQSMSPLGKELLLVLTKDIGHFQPMTRHESCW